MNPSPQPVNREEISMTRMKQIKNCWKAHDWRAVQWWTWPLAWLFAALACVGCLCGLHDSEQFKTGRKCLLCEKEL